MNGLTISTDNTFPVTTARGLLGKMVDEVDKKIFVLTKGGSPKAAIVDLDYLENLQRIVGKIYQKTYIDPKLLPYTREFSKNEIDEWLENDKI